MNANSKWECEKGFYEEMEPSSGLVGGNVKMSGGDEDDDDDGDDVDDDDDDDVEDNDDDDDDDDCKKFFWVGTNSERKF